MNFRQMTNEQIGLILMGLRAIYVADSAKTLAKLIEGCEAELAARGARLAA